MDFLLFVIGMLSLALFIGAAFELGKALARGLVAVLLRIKEGWPWSSSASSSVS